MKNELTNQDLMDGILRLDSKIEAVNRKLDASFVKLDAKIDSVHDKLDAKIDGVSKGLTEKIDSVYKKLDKKIDHQIDLTGRIINEFASDITKRVVKLELARA